MKIEYKKIKFKRKAYSESYMILGAKEFLLIGMQDYKEYDKVAKKSTDKVIGTKYTIIVHNPEKEIRYEKLDVIVLGVCTIPDYKNGEEIPCTFTNMVLTVSNIDFGTAELRAKAEKIELIHNK